MPLPISRDGYDSDPEIQAEMELAKNDPSFKITENSLVSQKKAAAERAAENDQVSGTPPNMVSGPITNIRTKSTDDVSKKPKIGNQTKALKKQRSRGISGCSSKKYSGFENDGYDLDGYDDEDYEECEVFDKYNEDEEYQVKKQ